MLAEQMPLRRPFLNREDNVDALAQPNIALERKWLFGVCASEMRRGLSWYHGARRYSFMPAEPARISSVVERGRQAYGVARGK
jgi:hypothetical protein